MHNKTLIYMVYKFEILVFLRTKYKKINFYKGFRILVSDYSAFESNGISKYYKGLARISNAEFVHGGQFSLYVYKKLLLLFIVKTIFNKPNLKNNRNSGEDSRYAMLFSDLGAFNSSRPTYVRNCAFHHGYSTAIGIFSSNSIPIENNVVHRTLNMGFDIQGNSNIIRNNLVALNYWPGRFLPWAATGMINFWGSIDVTQADSVVLENNYVAGAERIGINFRGDTCSKAVFGSMNHSIQNNTVVGTAAGAAILPIYAFSKYDCFKISGFTLFKNFNYGMYFMVEPGTTVDSNIFVDNQIAVLGKIHSPPSLAHKISGKTYTVTNNLFVGQTDSFSCNKDIRPNTLSTQLGSKMQPFFTGVDNKGKAGLIWGDFQSGLFPVPFKPWLVDK